MKRSLQEVKEILNKQRGVAPEMVDRLAKAALVRRKHRKTEEGTTKSDGRVMLRLKSTVIVAERKVVSHSRNPTHTECAPEKEKVTPLEKGVVPNPVRDVPNINTSQPPVLSLLPSYEEEVVPTCDADDLGSDPGIVLRAPEEGWDAGLELDYNEEVHGNEVASAVEGLRLSQQTPLEDVGVLPEGSAPLSLAEVVIEDSDFATTDGVVGNLQVGPGIPPCGPVDYLNTPACTTYPGEIPCSTASNPHPVPEFTNGAETEDTCTGVGSSMVAWSAPTNTWDISDHRLTRPNRGYPASVLASLPSCAESVSLFCPDSSTTYFLDYDKQLNMKIPAIYKATGQLVWAVAPAVNCTEAMVFRDCPYLEPYVPRVPMCDQAGVMVQGAAFRSEGVLLCGTVPTLQFADLAAQR